MILETLPDSPLMVADVRQIFSLKWNQHLFFRMPHFIMDNLNIPKRLIVSLMFDTTKWLKIHYVFS